MVAACLFPEVIRSGEYPGCSGGIDKGGIYPVNSGKQRRQSRERQRALQPGMALAVKFPETAPAEHIQVAVHASQHRVDGVKPVGKQQGLSHFFHQRLIIQHHCGFPEVEAPGAHEGGQALAAPQSFFQQIGFRQSPDPALRICGSQHRGHDRFHRPAEVAKYPLKHQSPGRFFELQHFAEGVCYLCQLCRSNAGDSYFGFLQPGTGGHGLILEQEKQLVPVVFISFCLKIKGMRAVEEIGYLPGRHGPVFADQAPRYQGFFPIADFLFCESKGFEREGREKQLLNGAVYPADSLKNGGRFDRGKPGAGIKTALVGLVGEETAGIFCQAALFQIISLQALENALARKPGTHFCEILFFPGRGTKQLLSERSLQPGENLFFMPQKLERQQKLIWPQPGEEVFLQKLPILIDIAIGAQVLNQGLFFHRCQAQFSQAFAVEQNRRLAEPVLACLDQVIHSLAPLSQAIIHLPFTGVAAVEKPARFHDLAICCYQAAKLKVVIQFSD